MKTKTRKRISARGAKRLLKLADWLDTIEPSKFNFATTFRKDPKCGSVGCAIGWCPTVFPTLCSVTHRTFKPTDQFPFPRQRTIFRVGGVRIGDAKSHDDWAVVGTKLFDISYQDSYAIFTPDEYSPHDGTCLSEDASSQEVAEHLRNFVAWAMDEQYDEDGDDRGF